jgi:hypothetical protein
VHAHRYRGQERRRFHRNIVHRTIEATDPTIGYPTELAPRDYGHARDLVPGERYRLFDALVRSAQLTFWISPLDLWSGWCSLQTPSVWDVAGKRVYRCVPQSANESNTDEGKLALCTSAEDLPSCIDGHSNSVPCACLNRSSRPDYGLPLCSSSYCACSATACRADLRGTTITGSLRLVGDRLVGNITFDVFGFPMTFAKVSP